MKTPLKYLSLAAALASTVISARAVPTLQLYDWFTNTMVTVPDQATGLDANLTPNVVTWVGSVGVWTVNVSTGISAGTASAPIIHLNTVDMSGRGDYESWGYQQLSIYFSVDNLGPTAGGAGVKDLIGGTTAGQVGVSDWISPYNSVPAFDILIDPPGWGPWYGPGAFSAVTYGGIPFELANPYSLTLLVDVVHFGPGITSIDVEKRVPDSSMTSVLLAFGLLGVGLASRRFKA
jgi:hypothetical protein